MRTSFYGLIASAAFFAGCALSPGHDLPSATENGDSGDGDFFGNPPGDGDGLLTGDGDASIEPPGEGVSSCPPEGGAGGMGGACAGAAPGP